MAHFDSYIFNTIITNSDFLTCKKPSKIIRLPKCNFPSNKTDFRPISILSSLSKPFELLGTQITANVFQYCFQSYGSTQTTLLKIINDIHFNILMQMLPHFFMVRPFNSFGGTSCSHQRNHSRLYLARGLMMRFQLFGYSPRFDSGIPAALVIY